MDPTVIIGEGERLPHQAMIRQDQKGVEGIFKCPACGEVGTLDHLFEVSCIERPPPCPYCGGTPFCEIDCPGVWGAIKDRDVYVGGQVVGDISKSGMKDIGEVRMIMAPDKSYIIFRCKELLPVGAEVTMADKGRVRPRGEGDIHVGTIIEVIGYPKKEKDLETGEDEWWLPAVCRL